MQMKLHGAVGQVTGSMIELKDEKLGVHFLIDCGSTQGGDDKPDGFPFEPSEIQFVLLTHAHLDHCGRLPELAAGGFKGPVYCAPETAELARIVLNGAVHVPGSGVSQHDVDRVRFDGSFDRFAKFRQIKPNLYVHTIRSSHILGAVGFDLNWGTNGRKNPGLVVSGDIGANSEQAAPMPLLARGFYPSFSKYGSRTVVMESTYGGREPEPVSSEQRRERLRDELLRTRAAGGTMVIPVFAIQRAQDVIFDLHVIAARNPSLADISIVAQGRSLLDANQVFCEHIGATELRQGKSETSVKRRWLNKVEMLRLGLEPSEDDEVFARLIRCALGQGGRVPAPDHSAPIARDFRGLLQPAGRVDSPDVVVAAGGMVLGGSSVHWVKQVAQDPNSSIALVGYCTPGTGGQRLLELAELGVDARRRLQDDLWPLDPSISLARKTISARIVRLDGYSGHASRDGLIDYVFVEGPGGVDSVAEKVILVHGDDGARRGLKGALEERQAELGPTATRAVSLTIESPGKESGWFDLDSQEWIEDDAAMRRALAAKVAKAIEDGDPAEAARLLKKAS